MTNSLLLGIDWGTSNRRAYVLDAMGNCVARHDDGQGLLSVSGDFAASLAALRAILGLDASVPVLMSGMVGSASGWQQVPYLDTSVPLSALPAHAVQVAGHPLCRIVPGYCARDGDGGVDVMRGEETQLLGATAMGVRDGWVVLPGTHSKWVLLRDGYVDRLATYMTGELFAMLAAGGTLAALMPDGPAHTDAFETGLQAARRGQPLSHTLFGVRARVVAGTMPAGEARSFVSGLLIGTEFAAAEGAPGQMLTLIGSAALGQRYAHAAASFGWQTHLLDPDQVYLCALRQFLPRASR